MQSTVGTRVIVTSADSHYNLATSTRGSDCRLHVYIYRVRAENRAPTDNGLSLVVDDSIRDHRRSRRITAIGPTRSDL